MKYTVQARTLPVTRVRAAIGLLPSAAHPGCQTKTEAHPMPFEWKLFLKVLGIILRILQNLPPDADHRPVARSMADGLDELNGTTHNPPP